MKYTEIVMVLCFTLFVICNAQTKKNGIKSDTENGRKLFGKVFEKGRTLVHNSIKRFQVLLPVIFFKLGIAFTMLVLVTIVSVNNGFIGFLLLVVGLSTVLSRLQAPTARSVPAVVPYANPVPYVSQVPVYHTKYIQDWDRKDKGVVDGQIYGQQYAYPQLSGYYKQNSASS